MKLTAIAPEVTSAELMELESQIVGAQAVADHATARLPDVSAFHAVGVSSITIDNGLLVAEMLPTARATDCERVDASQTKLTVDPSVQESKALRFTRQERLHRWSWL